MPTIEVKVPDIGDFNDVPVIEIFVKPGDSVKAEDPLLSLESDKATMEVPSPRAGIVKSVSVKVGDKVSAGFVILQMADAGGAEAPARPSVTRRSLRLLSLRITNFFDTFSMETTVGDEAVAASRRCVVSWVVLMGVVTSIPV